MTRVTKAERDEAIERLREWIKPGDTLYTVLRHRAASGMSRSIDVYGFAPEHEGTRASGAKNVRLVKSWYSYNIARAGIGAWDDKHEAVRVSGAGMDMGFWIVYELGRVLFPGGFGCIGLGCTANDHPNGDQDYTPYWHRDIPKPNNGVVYSATHWHNDGGYALCHEWLPKPSGP